MSPRELAVQSSREMWACRQAMGGFVSREGRLPTGPELVRAVNAGNPRFLGFTHLLRTLQTVMERLPEVAPEIIG